MHFYSDSAQDERKDRILSIDFPPAGKLRWRKLVRRSGSRPTGKYPSWKVGRMLHWESTHELNVFRLLDASPNVRTFCEQPVRITYVLGGQRHYHVPDVLVVSDHGRKILEVKTEHDATRPEIVHRTRFLSRCLEEHGYTYQIVIAEHLRAEPRLSQVLYVLRFGREALTLIERERLRLAVAASPGVLTWGQVADGKLGRKGKAHVCRLMLEGHIDWDPTTPLRRNTVLRLRRTAGEGL